MKFNKGSELDKQIYPEGDSTCGCKHGVLDVEDVKEAVRSLKHNIKYTGKDTVEIIDEIFGDKLK